MFGRHLWSLMSLAVGTQTAKQLAKQESLEERRAKNTSSCMPSQKNTSQLHAQPVSIFLGWRICRPRSFQACAPLVDPGHWRLAAGFKIREHYTIQSEAPTTDLEKCPVYQLKHGVFKARQALRLGVHGPILRAAPGVPTSWSISWPWRVSH